MAKLVQKLSTPDLAILDCRFSSEKRVYCLTRIFLSGAGSCGTAKTRAYEDRCGYGPRLPLLVISPYAKQNFVDHTITDQSSILRFIEDNWNTGRIGDQSFDVLAGSLDTLFDFHRHGLGHLFLTLAGVQFGWL